MHFDDIRPGGLSMHMADALISPTVGGTMWVATAALTAYSARKLNEDTDDSRTPLMGALGAFIFAAQMINFTIPLTGSSGHLGGGMILAILLGPYAGFLTMASVLTIQALFFADGGFLALGCNVFNLGFFPCFIAYPLIYRRLAGKRRSRRSILVGSLVSAIVGLQLGAFGVVLETFFSDISELPFTTFLLLMQPIHLAIGVVEGLVTAAVVTFVWKARPEILELSVTSGSTGRIGIKSVLAGFLVAAVIAAGMLSWFASANPDGLEWAMKHTSGKEELEAPEKGLHQILASLQEKTAFMPDYSLKQPESGKPAKPEGEEESHGKDAGEEPWPAVSAGTSVAGLVGGALTLFMIGLLGFGLKRVRRGKE
jgi:cobalt/nickel transport system permease protein